jgi:hypothetical protein
MLLTGSYASAQTCNPVLDGNFYVCPASVETYTATRGEVGSTLTWTLSGGGTILNILNNDTEAIIEWSDVPGGPYTLTVTESSPFCTVSISTDIVIMSEDIGSMACNNLVNVALDQNCQAVITPDMILEAPQYGDEYYTVHLFDENYNPIPGNVVDISYLGQILNVAIEHTCSGLSCSGRIRVIDNFAPGLSCRPDTIEIGCDEGYDPSAVGFPLPQNAAVVGLGNNEYSVVVPGDCGGVYTLSYSDVYENQECGSDYDFVITRTWVATDESGNSTSCEEYIGAVWGSLADMTLPPHYDGILTLVNHLPKFQCSDANAPYYWPHEYNPGPEVTGYPEWAGCSNIQSYYEDFVYKICGNSRKIVRQWLILDWCTGQDLLYNQLIIIEDNAAPVVSTDIETIYFSTEPGQCYGTAYPIPDPVVLFDCSPYSYTISYILQDENGDDILPPATENVFEGPEGFGIHFLPVDTTRVVYTITDECDNVAYAYIDIIVVDDESPTAVCDKHTVVTLTATGEAQIYATSVDDGSNDNCEIDRFEIRRMTTPCGYPEDLEFGELVNFCCEDVNETVIVVFRVYDINGYYSDCMVEVTVNDKMPPEFTYCPGNVYLECGEDYNDLSLTGEPTVEDNCETYDLNHQDYKYLGDCGTGYIRRDWIVTDGAGLKDLCRQYIYIEDNNPLTYDDMDWPDDILLDGCAVQDYHPDNTGWPVLNNTGCKDLGIGYTDQIMHNVDDVCLKILREWKVADWCETPPFTYITHTQVIEVDESTKPYFTSCKNYTVETDNNNCDAEVTVEVQADDACTPAADLKYNWEIDFDQDGTIDDWGFGKSFTRVFPHGKHWVYYTTADGCGNTASCTSTVWIKDIKAPTPICIAKLTTTMMTTGMVPIRAYDFNLCQCSSASFDNCTPSDELRFSFSSDVNDTTRIFTCDDLTNGVAESFDLEMWVTDLDGNQDFCNVVLVIMDNVNACEDDPNASANLSGLIRDEFNRGMPEFEVELEKDDAPAEYQLTDNSGKYVFENLDVYSKYKLIPKKVNDPLRGVSTLDLVLIQKHLLGLIELDSPFKLIAADANNTGSVTAGDLLAIRSLILGLTTEFTNNKSWRFINDGYEFVDPRAPWGFEEDFVVDELYIDSDSIDFVGIKVGDVNNSAVNQMHGQDLESRSAMKLKLSADDVEMNSGDEVTISLRNADQVSIEGIQFSIEYDSDKIQLVNINSTALSLNKSNVNYFADREGLLTLSWNGMTPVEIMENESTFDLVIRAKASCRLSDVLTLNSAYTSAEAYDEAFNKMDIDLRFETVGSDVFAVGQNTPNPFEDETLVQFYLPEDGQIKTTVFNSNGKIIHEIEGHYSKGTNTIVFNKDIFNYQGIYFYQMTDGKTSIVKKMIRTR